MTCARVARPQAAYVILKHVGVDPHGGEIGDGVELRLRLHVGIGQSVALGDVAGGRRVDGDVALHLAALVQVGDRLRRNAELPQALFGGLQQPAAFLRGHAMHILRECTFWFCLASRYSCSLLTRSGL